MILSVSIGPRTLLNDCNHSATAFFWRSARSSSGLTLGSFQKQCHPDPQIISGTVIRKKYEDLFN